MAPPTLPCRQTSLSATRPRCKARNHNKSMPAVLSYATLEPTTDDNKFDLLAKILLALLAGGSGGTVALENVTGISDFWKATLSGTPAANQVFGTDGAGVFTTFNISEVGINTLSLPTPDSLSVFAAHPDGA